MKRTPTPRLSVPGALLTAALLVSGCSTPAGYKQADKTGAGIAGFREEIVNGKKSVDATMKALGDVAATATTDPRPAFGQFSKQVADLEANAAKIRKRAQSMREQGQAYFKQWEQELSQVNNPEIRALAEQRRAKLQETFARIARTTEPLKAQFEPWMSDLKDLQRYLNNDLTIAGIDAASDLFARASKAGLKVQESLDAVIVQLNSVAATITPAKSSPEKGSQ